MGSKVLIDEQVLDNLLVKALPEEYDVLLEGYGLDEDEEDYLLFILMVLYGHLDIVLDWLNGDDAKQVLSGAEELGLNWFDKIEYRIRTFLHDNFVKTAVPLLLSWYSFGNSVGYSELNMLPSFSDGDWFNFGTLKQYNYDVISNLSGDVCVNLKDVLYNGIRDGLSVDELTQLLIDNGLQPKGKFSAKTRAEMIARTEKSRLINKAKLNCFKENGVEWVNIITRHDSRVCSICLEYEQNNPHKLVDVEDLLPLHPRCRCTYGYYRMNQTDTEEEIIF